MAVQDLKTYIGEMQMHSMRDIRKTIKQARRDGSTDNSIGRSMGISAAEIKRLGRGKYPGEIVAKRIGLKPRCWKCKRVLPVKSERNMAPKILQAGWVEYFMKKLAPQNNTRKNT